MVEDRYMEQAKEIVSRLTLEEKLDMLTTHHAAVERLGLKEFYIGCEVARGFVGRDPDKVSTVFPQPVGLASTFDTELMERLGEIAADEARAYYNDDGLSCLCLWGPTIDPVRDPRWGRTEEAYGEDVFLAGELSRAYTSGMAGNDENYFKTVPTLKHFCANNNEQDRGSDDSCFTLRQKFEYYYAPFENAVKNGGARSVMASYNKVNGVPSVCNTDLKNVLKDKWGLWFVVSDGGGFSQIYTSHHYTDSHSETFAEAIKAGCDTMTDDSELVKNAAKLALSQGRITEAEIDNALLYPIYARVKLGQLDKDCPFNKISKDIVDCQEHKDVNLRAAMEQVCLLKNNGILPVREAPGSIAVVGALADENLMDWYTGYSSGDISVLQGFRDEYPQSRIVHDSLWDIVSVKAGNGKYLSAKENGDVIADSDYVEDSELFELQNWGENWNCLFSRKYQRYVRLSDDCLKLHNRKVYDWFTRETFNLFQDSRSGKTVMEEFLGHKKLTVEETGRIVPGEDNCENKNNLFDIEVVSSGKERAAKIAAENELVVYCVGNHPLQTAKECYDRKTISLNVQQGTALTLFENNPSTVMVLVSSYPYAIVQENKALPAILYTSHAGAYLGTAVAQTISGKNVPSAKLPLTWYAGDSDLGSIKEYDIEKTQSTYMYFRGTPLYPFGYGLSYAEFEYLDSSAQAVSDGVLISVNVKNTSDTDGTEVVQVYYDLPHSEASRPLKKLCGFARVKVPAGETVQAKVKVPCHALMIYNVRNGKMILESGEYRFFAGGNSMELQSCCTLHLEGERLGSRAAVFEAQSFEEYENIRICYSKKLHEHYIQVSGWNGMVSYGGVDLKDKSRVVIYAAAGVKSTECTVKIGGEKISFVIGASDACDDFKEYSVEIPSSSKAADRITLLLGSSACIEKIAIE